MLFKVYLMIAIVCAAVAADGVIQKRQATLKPCPPCAKGEFRDSANYDKDGNCLPKCVGFVDRAQVYLTSASLAAGLAVALARALRFAAINADPLVGRPFVNPARIAVQVDCDHGYVCSSEKVSYIGTGSDVKQRRAQSTVIFAYNTEVPGRGYVQLANDTNMSRRNDYYANRVQYEVKKALWNGRSDYTDQSFDQNTATVAATQLVGYLTAQRAAQVNFCIPMRLTPNGRYGIVLKVALAPHSFSAGNTPDNRDYCDVNSGELRLAE